MASAESDYSEMGNDAMPGEMEVVDTFTKLIFSGDSELSDAELGIIRALRQVDHNVALDTLDEMGVYLRALGVREMIQLVSLVREHYPASLALDPSSLPAAARTRSPV